MRLGKNIVAAGTLAGALAAFGSAGAADLASNIAWTAYDVGSSGYNQAIGIGSALKNHAGITLRVLPGKNDVSRLAPLREKKVHFSAFGIGGYQAAEASYTFGQPEWGPQKLRMLSMSNSEACNTLLFAGDVGVKTFADLKGKRVPYVKGGPALNNLVYAYLRFADLDWKDVQVVEYGGYGQSLDALVEGKVDGAITISTAGFVTKAFAGPRGAYYAPVPHDDEAGWKRLREAAPWFFKSICKEGAGIEKPFEAASYPYPILITYDWQDEGTTFAMTKAMFDMFPHYKESAPGANGWALDRQIFEWVLPYHPGAIRYYKDVGVWTPEINAHNDSLLEREKVIDTAWNTYRKSAPADVAAFEKGWMKARADALDKESMPVVWREW